MSISNHFPMMGKSKEVKPVMLPPGRAKLETKPCPTGSMVTQKTIGMARVACFSATTGDVPLVTIRSGGELASSAA